MKHRIIIALLTLALLSACGPAPAPTPIPDTLFVDPTGVPLIYELDDDLKPQRHFYLGDPDAVAAAQRAVANQGKAR